MRWTVIAWLWLGAAACRDKAAALSPAAIRLCRDVYDASCAPPFVFGTVPIGVAQPVTLLVRNLGGEVLRVHEVAMLEGSGFDITGWSEEVPSGGAGNIALRMVAEAAGTYEALVAVRSNDPALAERHITVRYVALEAEWQANLVLCPDEGLVTAPPACSDSLTAYVGDVRAADAIDVVVWVYNVGANASLLRQQLAQTPTRADEIQVLTPDAGNLPVNGQARFVIRYRPLDALSDTAEVRFYDGPGDNVVGTLRVHASAKPNTPPQATVALFDANGATTAGRELWFDGRGSSDPEGDPLQYTWTVASAPLAIAWNPGNTKLAALPVSVAGSYVVRLQVADSLGATSSADLPIDVKPRYQLTISAGWNADAGDVDLHVVPEGQALFAPGECSALQPSAPWGDAETAVDDGLHAGEGTAVEEVQVVAPSPGSYSVYVHYFEPSDGGVAAVAVSAARDDGAVVFGERSQVLVARCDLWFAGTVIWGDTPRFVPAAQEMGQQCFGM